MSSSSSKLTDSSTHTTTGETGGDNSGLVGGGGGGSGWLSKGSSNHSVETTDTTSFAKRSNHSLYSGYGSSEELKVISGSLENTNKLSRRSSAIQKAGLTINQLQFDSLGLFGRDGELHILLECLNRCIAGGGSSSKTSSSPQPARELVTIGGLSGTGKSALAGCLRDPVLRAKGAIIRGKCTSPQEPYSGMASACQEFISFCYEHITDRREQIIQEMGNENNLQLLVDLMPELGKLLGVAVDTPTQDSSQATAEVTAQQFRYAFCRFFQCLQTSCLEGRIIVLILDDVQNSDQASLDLIQALLEDTENPNSIMIVTTYRSDEVEETHPFFQLLSQLRTNSTATINTTQIPLGNLGIDQVNQILMSVLRVDDDGSQTQDLAQLCYKRTLGNALFLRRFMVLLEQEQLLQFNYGKFNWNWDCQEIDRQTAVTENVVDLLTVKMRSLEPALQKLLSLASFLGPTFDWNTINLIWGAYMDAEEESSKKKVSQAGNSVEKWLWLAMEETFLEKDGHSGYRWSHDKVQEAASSLIPTEETANTQFQLGEILYKCYDQQQLNKSIFLVANLLNADLTATSSSSLTQEQQIRNARLNRKAASKAKDLSAFESAASYAKKGLDIMTTIIKQQQQSTLVANAAADDQWPTTKDDNGPIFQLLLDLYSVGAQAELAVGRSETATAYCQEVLTQRQATMLDKIRVYNVLLQSMGAGGRPTEAVRLALLVLEGLGCKFPARRGLQTFSAIRSFFSVMSKRNTPSKEDIQKLPLMTDPAKIECMKIMDMAGSWTHATGQSIIFLLFLGRMVDWTLRFGLSDRSPAVFGNLGFLVCHVKGNYELGMQWADHSVVALERVESKITESRVFMARAWAKPYKSTITPLVKGYKAGMMSGDVMNAVLCLWHVIHHALLSGQPLRKVEEDCRSYCAQMQSLKQKQMVETIQMTWQVILNLMGRSHNKEKTTALKGEAFDEEEFLSQEADDTVVFSMDHYQAIKSYLFCFFGDHEAGAALAVEKGDSHQKKNPGSPVGSVDCFARAVSLYDAARKDNKGKRRRLYQKYAIAARSALRAIAKKGNPNVTHLIALLDAEHAATVSKKRRQVLKSYQEAVNLAGRGGYVMDAALACERLADYFLSSSSSSSKNEEGDKEDARFWMEKAMEYYDDWGSVEKVRFLQTQLELLDRQLPARRNTEVWR